MWGADAAPFCILKLQLKGNEKFEKDGNNKEKL